jgi:hypothetical protein
MVVQEEPSLEDKESEYMMSGTQSKHNRLLSNENRAKDGIDRVHIKENH